MVKVLKTGCAASNEGYEMPFVFNSVRLRALCMTCLWGQEL
jgi:hypothetical protein